MLSNKSQDYRIFLIKRLINLQYVETNSQNSSLLSEKVLILQRLSQILAQSRLHFDDEYDKHKDFSAKR